LNSRAQEFEKEIRDDRSRWPLQSKAAVEAYLSSSLIVWSFPLFSYYPQCARTRCARDSGSSIEASALWCIWPPIGIGICTYSAPADLAEIFLCLWAADLPIAEGKLQWEWVQVAPVTD